MTVLVLNQQIRQMEKKFLRWRVVFFCLLPFIAVGVISLLGYSGLEFPVFVLTGFISAIGFNSFSGKAKPDKDKEFFQSLEQKKTFDMREAKTLLSHYKAVIYRIDSKTHTIQFFIDKKKYTMYIKNKID